MANFNSNHVQIGYRNEHLNENFNQAESELLFSWLEEILLEVTTESEVIERKPN
jgi:hypothetical protein